MAINLELPPSLRTVINMTHAAASEMIRPISRKYDRAEHSYPNELDTLEALFTAASSKGSSEITGAKEAFRTIKTTDHNRNGANMAAVLQVMEMSWGDVGLMLSFPNQGLGNAAISRMATDEQLKKLGKVWAAMAITEPGFGSDSAAVTATATRDGDSYVVNGEKIFVTAGSRASHIVVWATLDKTQGRAAIKPFIVPRQFPGVTIERLEHKLGIKASDTATIRFDNVRIPQDYLLGSPEIITEKSFSAVMETFDNTRPAVAAMAVGLARASLELLRELLHDAGVEISYNHPVYSQHAAASEFLQLESDWEAAYLLTLQAAWQADNNIPNSLQASMAKAKAGRMATEVTLKAVELAGTVGYSEQLLLEKWARDSKILDIFEGTQQIQQLIIARRLLGLNSAELK